MDDDTVQAESVHATFTATEGLAFERLPDGGVRIRNTERSAFGGQRDYTAQEWVLDAATWASAVCGVSDRGEADYRWYQARAFHTRGETAEWLAMVGDPLRHVLRHVVDGLAFGLLRWPNGDLVRERPDGGFERLGEGGR